MKKEKSVMRLVRLTQATGVVLVSVLFWLTLTQPAYAHASEGFHPEVLWSLLSTALMVVLAISALVGMLWLYRQAKSQRKQW